MAPKQFDKQKYLNIETFRKNGQGVKTPVWFVQDGETLHVWTQAGSGKVKRIHRDGSVRVVPSTATGAPRGEWIDGQAITDDSPNTIQYVESLMKKKYGLSFSFFRSMANRRGAKNIIIKIQIQR